jgi:acetyl-CoA C-acetyltransferase
MTEFGIQDTPSQKMVYEASLEALEHANMSMEEIDSIVVSNMDLLSNGERQRHSASILSSLFNKRVPIVAVPAGCAGGGTALWTAMKFHKSGNHKNMLVIGYEKAIANTSKRVTDEIIMGAERIYEQTEGLNFPAQNALVAQQYMLKYGATTDDFALVALKNHQNAFLNPKARFYKKEITLKQIKKSPIVASPLRLFDCSLSVNGAAAAIITKEKTDIEITGSSLYVDRISSFESEDMTTWQATVLAAKEAYSQAGILPKDIGIAEVHDAFTSVEMISYEDLGFCSKGEAKDLVREGKTNINGELPVNTSGGLKAKGHPISATGISQIYELVKQMRGEAGDRQINNVKYGLAQNIGGAGSTVSVHILKKVST